MRLEDDWGVGLEEEEEEEEGEDYLFIYQRGACTNNGTNNQDFGVLGLWMWVCFVTDKK